MSNPALEAAQRVVLHTTVERHRVAALSGAREALKPIRDLHQPGPLSAFGTARMEGAKQECRHCRRAWPCATARLAYSSEELSGE